MPKEVTVVEKPKCDFCWNQAEYDAKTNMGPWAYMCSPCFKANTLGNLGTGVGQKLVFEGDAR